MSTETGFIQVTIMRLVTGIGVLVLIAVVSWRIYSFPPNKSDAVEDQSTSSRFSVFVTES